MAFESPPPVLALWVFHEQFVEKITIMMSDHSWWIALIPNSTNRNINGNEWKKKTYQLWNFFGPLPEVLLTVCGVSADDNSPRRCFSMQSSIFLASSRFLSWYLWN